MNTAAVPTVNTKKKWKVPDTYTLVFIILIIVGLLTYILPAGEYKTVLAQGKKVVDPATFKFIPQAPIGLLDFLLSITKGMAMGQATIFMVLLVGGYLQVIADTGAIDASISYAIYKFQGRVLYIIPIVMLAMTILGAMGIVVNAVIAFIPIGLVIAKKMKLDPIFAMSLFYLGAYCGFAVTPIGAFTLAIAQDIAGIPIFSGIGLRSVVWLLVFAVTVVYVVRYAKKVLADSRNSYLFGEYEFSGTSPDQSAAAKHSFNARHVIIILILIMAFVVFGYGSNKLNWATGHLSAVMLAAALLSGIIGRMNPDDMAKSFINGCKSMVYGALVIGFAGAITVVMTEGKIIHTVIYYMSLPLTQVGPILSGVGMFWANLIFNFFVPSGSGQAYIVMPLMAPMADIVGITKQVACMAYQYGDGMSNTIIPTSGVLMGCLGVAGIPFAKWLKFMLPLFLIWVLIGTMAVIFGVATGWA